MRYDVKADRVERTKMELETFTDDQKQKTFLTRFIYAHIGSPWLLSCGSLVLPFEPVYLEMLVYSNT